MTRQGEFLGTPEYLAPEIIRHQVIGPPCDIYSLGVLLFEVMTGQLPYTGKPFDVLTAHLRAPIPSLRDYIPQVPAGLERVFTRAMAKQPTERHASAKEFADELTTILKVQGRDAFESSISKKQEATRQQDVVEAAPRRKKRALSSVPTVASSTSVHIEAEVKQFPWQKMALMFSSIALVVIFAFLMFRSSEPKFPKQVRLSSVGRGALRVSWLSAGDVVRVEVRAKSAKDGEDWLPHIVDKNGVSIAGLLPGRAYSLRMRMQNKELYGQRSFIAPFSSLTLKEVFGPKRLGEEAEMNLKSEEALAVSLKGVVGGDSRKWRFSEGPSKSHRFAYALDESFRSIVIEGRRKDGSRTQPGLPVKELSKRVVSKSRDLDMGKLVKRLVAKFGTKLNEMNLPHDERRKLIIDELLRVDRMRDMWALFPFIPIILQDDELPNETKQAIYDGMVRLFPLDQFGLYTGAKHILDIEKLVAPFCFAGFGTQGQGITIDTYEDRDNSLEPQEMYIFYGKGMMVRRKSFVGDDPVYPTITASFPLTSSALTGKKRALLFVTYKEAPSQYAYKVTINNELSIYWADSFSDTEQLGNIFGAGKTADWGAKTSTRKWSFPVSYFKEGDNQIVFSADAPFGMNSPTTPSLVRAAYSLE